MIHVCVTVPADALYHCLYFSLPPAVFAVLSNIHITLSSQPVTSPDYRLLVTPVVTNSKIFHLQKTLVNLYNIHMRLLGNIPIKSTTTIQK